MEAYTISTFVIQKLSVWFDAGQQNGFLRDFAELCIADLFIKQTINNRSCGRNSCQVLAGKVAAPRTCKRNLPTE